MRCIKPIIIAFVLLTGCFALAGTDGHGADTYLSQLRESCVIGADIMKRTDRIEGVSDHLNQIFGKFKKTWIDRLESKPKIAESQISIYVDGAEKAAVSNTSTSTIELNIPYWQNRPISMVQSIVLAIHEAAHLENLPLSHRELDEIGFALVEQNLPNYFGTSGLQKIVETHKDLSPREKVQILFEDSNAPANLTDFSYYDVWEEPKYECVVYPPKQNLLYSHMVRFYKIDFELAPDSPLFPGGKIQTALVSSFQKKTGRTSPNPTNHMMEQTNKSLIVKFWGDISMDGERFESWAWLRYEFRKNGNLLAFKMTLNDSSLDSYGYCWDKK